MISEDVRIQGFDARAFTNLVSLFAPNVVHRHERDPAGSDAPELALDPGAAGPDGSLVVVVSARGTLRKVFHTVHGRVRDLDWRGFGALEGLPERYGARRVVALTEGVLEDAFARASARMHREDDYVAQWLHVVRAIREEMDQGRIVVHPRPFVSVPLPTSQLVRRTLDSVLPDDRAFVLAVWRGPTLWTAAILRRRGGEIDWVAVGAMVALLHALEEHEIDEVSRHHPTPWCGSFPWWDFDALLADVGPSLDPAARAGIDAALGRLGAWPELVTDRVLCHGDVHPGNVLQTVDGPVLLDWDLLSLGPPAWDHGPLLNWTSRWGGAPGVYERFADGYGRSFRGDPLAEALAELRLVAATLMRVRAGRSDPAAAEEAERRLRYWRSDPDAPPWHAA